MSAAAKRQRAMAWYSRLMPARRPAVRRARCSPTTGRHRGHHRRCAVPERALDAGRQLHLRDRRRQRHLPGRPAACRDLFGHFRIRVSACSTCRWKSRRRPALQNIDVYAQVGLNAAYTISQTVTVNDGSLSIQVGPGSSSPGNVENAKLNAFAVYSTSAPTSPTVVDRRGECQPERGQQRQHAVHLQR